MLWIMTTMGMLAKKIFMHFSVELNKMVFMKSKKKKKNSLT